MASKRLWCGISVMALVFVVTVVGCEDKPDPESKPETDPALNGTWIGKEPQIIQAIVYEIPIMKFSYGNIETSYKSYSYVVSSIPYKYGNYTTTRDGTITITYTHYSGHVLIDYFFVNSREWYSKDDLKKESYHVSQNERDKILNDLFSPHTYSYSITDSKEGEILSIGEDSYTKEPELEYYF